MGNLQSALPAEVSESISRSFSMRHLLTDQQEGQT